MSKRQYSKRSRGLRLGSSHFDSAEANVRYNDRLWVFRGLYDPYVKRKLGDALEEHTDLELLRKAGGLTLTLLYPRAVSSAIHASPLRGFVSVQTVMDNFESASNNDRSLKAHKVARILGLGQFGGNVGLSVSYPEFGQDRDSLMNTLRNVTNTRSVLHPMEPHISIARGTLPDAETQAKILGDLPEITGLGKTQFGYNVNK